MAEQATLAQTSIRSVGVFYRGILQKSLAKRLCRDIVLAARREGRTGISFGRYGDSPERDGIPAKYFSVLAGDDEELEAHLAKYEAEVLDVVVLLDDTLLRGLESWAWYGLEAVNKSLKKNGVLLIVSQRPAEEILAKLPKKEYEYKVAVVKGPISFAGLWVYNDDMTAERILGAMAKASPQVVGLEALSSVLKERPKGELRLEALKEGFEGVELLGMERGKGIDWPHRPPEKPKWYEMPEGIMVPAVPFGKRNEQFKRFSNRTQRPLVDFDKCIKCTLCWIECPDGAFDVAQEGYYPVNYEYCSGCGICSKVCPIKDCIVMVDELLFDDLEDLYQVWKRDREGYRAMLMEKREAMKSTLFISKNY